MTECAVCCGSGLVAVGPWGARPQKVTCLECAGYGKVLDSHVYPDHYVL